MKSNGFTTMLNIVLAFCLLLAALFSFQVLNLSKDLRAYTSRVNTTNGLRGSLQSLATDCVEYSKRNPAIDPILESVNLKPAKASAPKATGK
jgi:hypothetical protein